MLPLAGLGFMALDQRLYLSKPVLEGRSLVLISFGISAALVVPWQLLSLDDPKERPDLWGLPRWLMLMLGLTILMTCLPYEALTLANQSLDRGAPSARFTQVLAKKGCKGRSCMLWTRGEDLLHVDKLPVDPETYAAAKEFGTLELTVMPGRFGWPWVAATAAR